MTFCQKSPSRLKNIHRFSKVFSKNGISALLNVDNTLVPNTLVPKTTISEQGHPEKENAFRAFPHKNAVRRKSHQRHFFLRTASFFYFITVSLRRCWAKSIKLLFSILHKSCIYTVIPVRKLHINQKTTPDGGCIACRPVSNLQISGAKCSGGAFLSFRVPKEYQE